MNKDIFATLNAINVNDHTEKKEGLTYLSWAWAWAEVKKAFPDAEYKVWKDELHRPYICDDDLGYMVFTTVTIGGISHEMWLPVMDSKNKAMKREPYEYQTRYGKKTVEAATMMDVNKSIMRCLVKNLAMFGLGLYIYAGEDLPESDEEPAKPAENAAKPAKSKKITTIAKEARKSAEKSADAEAPAPEMSKEEIVEEASAKARVIGYANRHLNAQSIERLCKCYKIKSLQEMTLQMCVHYISALEKNGGSIDE